MSEFRMPVSATTDGEYFQAGIAVPSGTQHLHRDGTLVFSSEAKQQPASVCICCGARRLPNGQMPCDH